MAQPAVATAHLQDQDPVARFKALVPLLREELNVIIRNSAECLQQYTGSGATQTSSQQQFEKSLEKFNSLCDQTELQLRLALECGAVNTDTMRYVGVTLQNSRPEESQAAQSEGQNLAQYIALLKSQANCMRDLQQVVSTSTSKQTEDTVEDR